MNPFRDVPVELIQRFLRHCNRLESSIAIELLLASYPQPFWIRIYDEQGSIRDAINPLLPSQWSRLDEGDFPISTMQASEIVLLRWDDVATIPAYVVAWVARIAPTLLSYDFVTAAAQAGRLDLIRLLHAFGIRKFCMGTMDAAASAGQLFIVRFLHLNRKEGCTAEAMDNAIKNGHLDVAQFLAKHRTELCTYRALETAIRNGDVDAVRFLQTVVKCEPDLHVISSVPDLKTLKVVHEELGWPITSGLVRNIASQAADALRYCLERSPSCEPVAVMMVCFGKGSVEAMAVVNEFFPNEKSLWCSNNWDSVAQK
ncbi:hypothetical protein HDU96_003923, partial [Phlyctochytrium bullatum]